MKFIKYLVFSFAFFLCALALNAQNAPAGINYQAVLRDQQGQIIADQEISVKVSVNDPEARSSFYTESHTVTTNNVGIFSLVVGGGRAEKGLFKDIPWSTANTWLEVAYDTDNNGIYEITGTTRMLSVPYAFYAERAGSAANGTGPNPTGAEGGDVLGQEAWMLKGNSDVDENGMWLGTQNYADLVVKTHEVERMRITKGVGGDLHDALIILYENVEAQKSMSIGEDLEVKGHTLLNDELMVVGNTYLNADLSVEGNATIDKVLYVKGNVNADGDVVFNQDLTIQEDLSVWGEAKIDGNLYVHHSLFVDFDGDFGRNLHVGNDADIDHDLNVDNDAHIGRDLDVDRNANIDVNLHVGNDADIDHNLNVDNDGHFGRDLDVDRNLNVDVDAHIGRDLDVDRNVNIDNNLTVQNDAFIKGDLDVDGTGTFFDLHVERDADIDRNLNVDNDGHFGRDVDVDRDVNIDRNLNVDFDAHIGVNLDVDNNVNIDNNLYVDNNTIINNDLRVNNNTYINNDLTVNHNTTINNDLSVTNDVYVGGTLEVANPITANCRLVVNSCVNGSDQDLDSYPVLVQGGNQGIAIKVDGGRSNDNNFVAFWDANGIQGRIEGQTYGELTTSFAFIWTNAMAAAQEAVAIAMIVACGFQLDLGEVAVWSVEAAVIAAEWIEYNVSITNEVGVIYESGSGDYAEWLERANPSEDYNFGEIVGVIGGKISRNTDKADHFMVVSKSPIVLGNMPAPSRENDYEKVAFMGQVPVRVMGRVAIGDYILPSGNNDGFGKAVKSADLRTEDFARIVGVAWQAGESFPMNVVNVAVGINTNDLANRVSKQQQAMEVMQGQMNQMQQQMNQLYTLLGQKSPYEGVANLPVASGVTALPAQQIQVVPTQEPLQLEMAQILDKNPELFIECFAKAKAKLEAKGVDINKFPEVAVIYNDPIQWVKNQNEKGYLNEMLQKAKQNSKK